MKTSIETINGKLCTVIWHDYIPNKSTLGRRFAELYGDVRVFFMDADCLRQIATALPALPRHPKPEDAKLLWRYMAEGMYIRGRGIIKVEVGSDFQWLGGLHGMPAEITYVVDAETGESVEVAISKAPTPKELKQVWQETEK